jgi:hypothetical protein
MNTISIRLNIYCMEMRALFSPMPVTVAQRSEKN